MSTLLAHLQALEIEIHHPGVCCERARLEELLHPDFHEVGRSGRPYDRATVIRFLAEQRGPSNVVSDDFHVCQLAAEVVLLTYRSAHHHPDGQRELHTLRSSLWVKDGEAWQLRYHQGTAAAMAW